MRCGSRRACSRSFPSAYERGHMWEVRREASPDIAHPGYACRSSHGLIAEALLQQDAVDVHHHPVVELAPLPVFRPQVRLDQLGDLIERELVSRFLLCCGYGSGQVFKIFANCRDLCFRCRSRSVAGHDAIEVEGFDLAQRLDRVLRRSIGEIAESDTLWRADIEPPQHSAELLQPASESLLGYDQVGCFCGAWPAVLKAASRASLSARNRAVFSRPPHALPRTRPSLAAPRAA